MDEPKVGQDTSERDTSVESKVTSETPQPHTKESEEKAVSDALSAAGRDAKTLSDKTAEAERILTDAKRIGEETKAEQKRWQDERDTARREAIAEDPAALKSLDREIRQRNKDTELAKREQELDDNKAKHSERLEKADKVTKEQNARDIASKHNVDAESLIKFTDGSTEAMEGLAQQLPKLSEKKPPIVVDTSRTIGGKGDLSGLSPTDRKKAREADAYKEK